MFAIERERERANSKAEKRERVLILNENDEGRVKAQFGVHPKVRKSVLASFEWGVVLQTTGGQTDDQARP